MLKKIICSLLLFSVMLSFSACENDGQSYKDEANAKEDVHEETGVEIDVDLTKFSSTMVYSEVYNMLVSPGDYMGKIIKMNGQFAVYQDPSTGSLYYAVIIADATACCSQGLEFVLAGNLHFPDDYPDIGTELTVTGMFQTYEENGYQYCHLVDAEMA